MRCIFLKWDMILFIFKSDVDLIMPLVRIADYACAIKWTALVLYLNKAHY